MNSRPWRPGRSTTPFRRLEELRRVSSTALNPAAWIWREVCRIAGAEPIVEHPKTGMLLSPVPEGQCLSGEDPPFKVELPAYYIGMHPVTNGQSGGS